MKEKSEAQRSEVKRKQSIFFFSKENVSEAAAEQATNEIDSERSER